MIGRQTLRAADAEWPDQASRINARDPKERLTAPPADDELGLLAASFNGLLDRLASALHQQRQFMADASHELRTPVSVVRTATQVTLARDARSADEYRESLVIVGEQANRLSRLVDAMFLLSRAEAQGVPLRREFLNLDDILAESARALRVLADQRGVTVTTDGEQEVGFTGDDALLRQMIGNLLDNAIRHAGSDGAVVARSGAPADRVTLRITNDGPGIAPADQRADLRAVRPDRRVGRCRPRTADRAMDCRGAWRHAGARVQPARLHDVRRNPPPMELSSIGSSSELRQCIARMRLARIVLAAPGRRPSRVRHSRPVPSEPIESPTHSEPAPARALRFGATPPGLPAGVRIDDGLSRDEAVAIALWNNAAFQVSVSQLGFARADLVDAGHDRQSRAVAAVPGRTRSSSRPRCAGRSRCCGSVRAGWRPRTLSLDAAAAGPGPVRASIWRSRSASPTPTWRWPSIDRRWRTRRRPRFSGSTR